MADRPKESRGDLQEGWGSGEELMKQWRDPLSPGQLEEPIPVNRKARKLGQRSAAEGEPAIGEENPLREARRWGAR